MNTSYTFHLAPADAALLPQLSRALEQRTQLRSREAYPRLWKLTDRLNGCAAPSASGGRSPGRTVLSVICFLLGLFLTIPFIFEPDVGLIPGLVGMFAAATGAVFLWRCSKKLLALLSLSIGLVLTAGAVLDTRQLGCFLPLGSAMILLGAAALIVRKRPATDRFEKAARQLIDSRNALPRDQVNAMVFGADGILDGDRLFGPYADLDGVYETEDLFLLELAGKFLMLQKSELTDGSPEEFGAFLSRQMK